MPASSELVAVIERGENALTVRDFAEAEQLFREALEAESANPSALIGLGQARWAVGNALEAEHCSGRRSA